MTPRDETGGSHRFATTRWSIVLEAGGRSSAGSREALASLCRTYWFPLYAWARRQGHSAPDSEDLTQEFFLRLLDRRYLAAADPGRGRFRNFLAASFRHFAANEYRRAGARKRGGHAPHLPLDFGEAERRYTLEPRDAATPETLFERSWALALLEQALGRLRGEFERAGKGPVFARLKVYLTDTADAASYAALAAELETTEGAVKVAIHRLRRRYRDLLREEIAHTVGDPSEIEGELRHLRGVLRG